MISVVRDQRNALQLRGRSGWVTVFVEGIEWKKPFL